MVDGGGSWNLFRGRGRRLFGRLGGVVAIEQAGLLGPGAKSWSRIARCVGRWLLSVGWCCLVALALAAVQLLPTIEAGTQTTRSAVGMI